MIQKGFRRYTHVSATAGVGVLVPQPPPNRNTEMKSAGDKFSPAISKEMDCAGGPHPPSGRSVLCRIFQQKQKDNHSINRDTFSSWRRRPVKQPEYLIMKDYDTHWAPHPPPNGDSEVKPVGSRQKACGNIIGSQQPKIVPCVNQNGVGVPHPPPERVFCKQYKEEQKDVPSLRQDTYSSWCRKLPTLKKRDGDLVSALKNMSKIDRDSISIRWKTFSRLPNISKKEDNVTDQKMSSEEDSICGEEKKDEVRNVFTEDLERRRKPLKDHEMDAQRLRWERYYERTKRLPTILQIFADELKDQAQDEDIFSLAFKKMQETLYGQDRKNNSKYLEDIDADTPTKLESGDTGYETFSRHFTEGCWDLWCLRKYISDFAASHKHEIHKICNAEEEASSEEESVTKLLNRLQKRQTYLHDALKSYAAAREKAQRRDEFFADISEMLTDFEYQKLQKLHTSKFFREYKDLLLQLMLPEWQKKFEVNPEDLFYFQYPQDLLDWLSCLGMSDLAEV